MERQTYILVNIILIQKLDNWIERTFSDLTKKGQITKVQWEMKSSGPIPHAFMDAPKTHKLDIQYISDQLYHYQCIDDVT